MQATFDASFQYKTTQNACLLTQYLLILLFASQCHYTIFTFVSEWWWSIELIYTTENIQRVWLTWRKKTQQNINKPRKNLGQFCMRAYCLKWWFFYRIEFENGKSDRYILTTFHCSQMKSDYSTGSRFHCNNCCECNNCNRSHCMKVLFIPTFMHIIIQCM